MFEVGTHSLTDCLNNIVKFSSNIMQNMEFEWLRLASFSSFPNNFVSALRLAQTGFYYNGNRDEVTCFRCGLKHGKWREGDVPSEVHKALSPDCSFLTRQFGDVLNKHTLSDRSASNQNAPAECSVDSGLKCFGTSLHSHGPIMSPSEIKNNPERMIGRYGGQTFDSGNTSSNVSASAGSVSRNGLHADGVLHFPFNGSSNRQGLSQRLNTEIKTPNDDQNEKKTKTIADSKNAEMIEPLGISFDKPFHQHFAVLAVRLNSFQKWPANLTQTPQDLSKAGFFYEGTGDKVYCFFCGGGLFNWDPGDDPWEEHARWFPKCVFLRQCKGDEFVMRVQKEKDRAESMRKQGGSGSNKPNQNGLILEPVSFSHPAAVSVLEMGYKPTIIRKALEAFIKDEDQTDLTAELLLMKIWDIEKNINRSNTNIVDNVQPNAAAQHGNKTMSNSSRTITDDRTERRAILEENRQLKELQTCKICLDEEVSIVFLPCGHMSSCASCAPALRKCPICRTFIKGTVKAIIS